MHHGQVAIENLVCLLNPAVQFQYSSHLSVSFSFNQDFERFSIFMNIVVSEVDQNSRHK